jgi:serine/threonine protein kinase
MSRIMEMVGLPSADLLAISGRKEKFFVTGPDGKKLEPVMAKNSRGKLRKPLGKPVSLVIGDEDPDFTDFVQKCLEWNPAKRMTPDTALKHVWVLKGLPP